MRGLFLRIGSVGLIAALLVGIPTLVSSVGVASPSSTTTGTVESRSSSADASSPIDVAVDEKTRKFREELARRQARAREFEAQLDQLDTELAIAAEAYNEAADKLASTKERLQTTEEDLGKARAAYETQSDLLARRADSVYRNGEFAALDLLLDAKSVSDLLARLKFLNTIGMRDAQVAEQLKGQQDQVEQTALTLRSQQKEAEALEFDLEARQIEIMLRIQERQAMLATAQNDILELLDAEAARRAQDEADLLREILSGASKAGIQVAPGTPVETALSYHGVPYLWGGETPAGFDCSGLVLYVFRQHGVSLPHYSGSQFLLGEKVSASDLQPSDVVFFGSPIHHVGIYIGGGYYLHAPKTGDYVKISRLADRYDYAGARRYDWKLRVGPIAGTEQISPNVNHNVGVQLAR